MAQIVARSGCTIVEVEQLDAGDWAYRVECPTHAAKVDLLANLAAWDSTQPEILRLARTLAAMTDRSREGIARELHRYVRDEVVHLREPRELFRPAGATLEEGLGDCDCSSRALLALLQAAGQRAGLVTLANPPKHVAVAVLTERGWLWADPSLGAELGEHPIDAAERLGMRVDPAILREEDQQIPPQAEVVAFAVLGAMGELVSAAISWRRPRLPAVLAGLVLGAYTPAVLKGIAALWAPRVTEPTVTPPIPPPLPKPEPEP
jgi:hypothetical protein